MQRRVRVMNVNYIGMNQRVRVGNSLVANINSIQCCFLLDKVN